MVGVEAVRWLMVWGGQAVHGPGDRGRSVGPGAGAGQVVHGLAAGAGQVVHGLGGGNGSGGPCSTPSPVVGKYLYTFTDF